MAGIIDFKTSIIIENVIVVNGTELFHKKMYLEMGASMQVSCQLVNSWSVVRFLALTVHMQSHWVHSVFITREDQSGYKSVHTNLIV